MLDLSFLQLIANSLERNLDRDDSPCRRADSRKIDGLKSCCERSERYCKMKLM